MIEELYESLSIGFQVNSHRAYYEAWLFGGFGLGSVRVAVGG
jgi:hypothetical protein